MTITAAALQAAGDSANTMRVYQVQQGPIAIDATYDAFYVVGTGDPYSGRSMWVRTTSAGNAAAQHAEVIAALAAGPVDTNALDN